MNRKQETDFPAIQLVLNDMPLIVPIADPLVDIVTDIFGCAGSVGLLAAPFFLFAALLPLLQFDALFLAQIRQLAPPLVVILNFSGTFICHPFQSIRIDFHPGKLNQ